MPDVILSISFHSVGDGVCDSLFRNCTFWPIGKSKVGRGDEGGSKHTVNTEIRCWLPRETAFILALAKGLSMGGARQDEATEPPA